MKKSPKLQQTSDSVLAVGISVKRLQTVLHNQLESGFQTHGLSLPQWDVLRTLHAFPGASGAGIARECLVTPQTVNLILPRLVETGLIERRHAAHGRTIETWLTQNGKIALDRCNAHARTVENELVKLLTQKERDLLVELLKRCTKALMGDQVAEVRFT